MRKLEIKRTTLAADEPAVNPLHETTVFELDASNEERSIVVTMDDNETAVVTIQLKGDNVVYDVEQRAAMLVVGSGELKDKLTPPPATMSTASSKETLATSDEDSPYKVHGAKAPEHKPVEHKSAENKPTVSPGGAVGSDQLPGRNPSTTPAKK
jgi:hypothetical protein